MQSTSNWGVICLSAVLMACGSGDDGTDTSETTDTGTTSTINTNTTSGEDTSATLNGIVTDAAGTALNEVDIRFCRGAACRNAKTDANGVYDFDEVAVDAWYSLELVGPTGSGLATALVPVTFGKDEARALDVILPSLDAATTLAAAAEIQMGSGLWITVGTGDLEPPFLMDEATEVAGVQLTSDQFVPTDGVTATVAAQWHTSPFDYHAAAGLPVRIDAASAGLTGAGPYTLWVASYEQSTWIEIGALTDDGNGSLTTTATLPLLSTIMVTE